MTHKINLIFLFWILLISPQLATCKEASPYPIVDSGVWATNSHPGDIYWLDNDHVLFLGSGTATPVTKEDQWLLIWDTKANQITKYKQHVGGFSYCDGTILYAVASVPLTGRKITWTYYRGKLSEETIDLTPDRREDKLNCRLISAWPKFPQGKAQAILRDQDGFLVRDETVANEKFENYPILYYRARDKEVIPLPFHRYEADRVNYYPFRQAYFLAPASYFRQGTHLTPWPKNVPLYVWWLFPDGRVEKVEIPLGAWTKGGLRFVPNREGLFLINKHSKSNRDPGDAGGYLVQGTTVKKLISGVLTDVSVVSPDGCRIAFSHAPSDDADSFDAKNKRTLKMIDVCMGGVEP